MPNWKRLREAGKDVLGGFKGRKAVIVKTLALLTMLGVPVVALVNRDTLLPPSGLGVVLWLIAPGAALVLGIHAAYRLRSQFETIQSPERARRNEAREAACSALAKILGRLYSLVLPSHFADSTERLRQDLGSAVQQYDEAASRLHPHESIPHAIFRDFEPSAARGLGARPATAGTGVGDLNCRKCRPSAGKG